MLAQAIVGEFCRSGAINDSIEHVKRALRERRDALVDALAEYIGDDATFVRARGRLLPVGRAAREEVDTSMLLAAAVGARRRRS